MIGTTAAILGAAVIGAGASAVASHSASSAATNASDKNAAIQQQQYNQTRSDLLPYAQAGNSALSALQQRLGLTAPGATTSPGPSATGGAGSPAAGAATPAAASGQPNWDQLLKDRPDVMAEYQRASAAGDKNSPAYAQAGLTSPQAYAAHWYNDMGGSNSYQLPPSGAQPATMPAADQPSTIPGQTFTSADNGGLGARDPNARPDYTAQQPTIGAGPSSATYTDPSQFTTSPGYQFRLDEGIRNLNAGYGAKGLLKSGSAMEGINDYAAGSASSEYGNWFNQQMSKLGADQNQFNNDRSTGLAQYNQNRNVFNTNYNTDTARYDANFNSDRGYNTDMYNNYTGNLFNLAGIGQGAAAGTAAAGTNYASGMTANNNNLASVQGNAAIAGANGINGAINTGVQAYGAYSNPFSVTGGGGSGAVSNGTGWIPAGTATGYNPF